MTAHSKTYGNTRRMRYKAKVELEAYEQLLLKLIYKLYMFATINDVVGICIMHQGNILVTLSVQRVEDCVI